MSNFIARRLSTKAFRTDDLEARIEYLQATIEQITALHKVKTGESDHGPYAICDYDKTAWPCRTIRIIGGKE